MRSSSRYILSVFRLIELLKDEKRRNVEKLAFQLGVHQRTVYRYFKIIEEVGFIIDTDFEGNYFIHTSPSFKLEKEVSNG